MQTHPRLTHSRNKEREVTSHYPHPCPEGRGVLLLSNMELLGDLETDSPAALNYYYFFYSSKTIKWLVKVATKDLRKVTNSISCGAAK